jgi:hypothetical protein
MWDENEEVELDSNVLKLNRGNTQGAPVNLSDISEISENNKL